MADTDDMIYVAQSELEKLVCQNTSCVCEAEQTMVRKDSPQAHSPCMENCLLAKITETCMTVDDLNSFSNDDVAKDGKEREHCWESRLPINHQKRNMIDFEAVGQIPYALATFVCMSDDYDLVAAVNQLLYRDIRNVRSRKLLPA